MSIIGGKFGLPETIGQNHASPSFLEGEPILLFNARSGIKLVVDFHQPKSVWVPSYLCPTIISAIDKAKTKVKFFPINERLKLTNPNFITQVQPGDLIIFIDYFGFTFEEDFIKELKQKEVVLLEDCCQALFMPPRKIIADYWIFSPRKFLGVPDGGILYQRNQNQIKQRKLSIPPDDIFYSLLSGNILRREFDLFGTDNHWNTHIHRGESRFSPQNYQMSQYSKTLLKNGFDYTQITSQRRNNFFTLNRKLNDITIFPGLGKDIVPLGFPVMLDNRDEIQQALFDKQIFPPIHWDIKTTVPKEFTESHRLSKKMLTLPCDQRYSKEEMTFVADTLLELI